MNTHWIKPGDVFRTKTGEILRANDFAYDGFGEFFFSLLSPTTLKETNNVLSGPLHQLDGFIKEMDFKKIDLKTFKPTGLVKP